MRKKRCIDLTRGQISIFFILSLLFILLITLFLFTLSSLTPEMGLVHKKNLETQFTRQSLESYVEYCIINESIPILKQIGLNGGTLNKTDISRNSKKYNGVNYRKLCVYIEGTKYCVNRILSVKDMEKEISQEILNNIEDCIDFKYFTDKGYKIDLGNKSLDVKITNSGVTYDLFYQIIMKIEEQEINVDKFYTTLEHPIGMAYKLVLDIINQETTKGYFNKDKWIQDNNLLFSIEKNKPYPYIIYSINTKDNFIFNFALETEDKASRVGRNYLYDLEYGCCYIEQNCFKNTEQMTCRQKGGIYDPNINCECKEYFIGTSVNNNLKNCNEKKSGESWCENSDGIGSRDVLYSCHDGEIYIEECRDFKEEICIENIESGLSTATCKINRWNDCTRCNTIECCENDLLRDCIWMEKEYYVLRESDSGQCVPKVAPGFRFWEGVGQEVCNIGTRYALCEGYSCDKSWVEYVSKYCSLMGDCGMNKNYKNILTTSGYFNTDPVHKAIYSDRTRPFISTNKAQETLVFSDEIESIDLIPSLISAWLNYLNDVSRGRKIILDYSFCNLWQQPIENQLCHLCNENDLCSEYKCYSLGQACIYSEINGYPHCDVINENEEDFDIYLTSEYDYEESTINIAGHTLTGFNIIDQIPPYELLNLGIITSKPTKCKITYMPQLKFTETPAIWFGKPEFSKTHDVSFRLPEKIKIPEKLYENLNINSIEELYEIIIKDYDTLKDSFDSGFIDIIKKLNEFLSGKDYLIELLRLSISGIDENKYHLFLRCSDESGKENPEPVFITFRINEDYNDITPASLITSFPINNSRINNETYKLQIFLDKPAECRLSSNDKGYGAMEEDFECETTRMRLSPIGGGSYECNTITNILQPYIRCIDNPPELHQYNFNIELGFNETDINYEINNTNIILLEQMMFNNTVVYMPEPNSLYDINMILPDYYDCRLGFNNFNYDTMYDLHCEEINTSSPYYIYGSNNCSKQFAPGNYTVYVLCVGEVPHNRNINSESFYLEYFLDEGLSIISLFPEYYQVIERNRVELSIIVNRDIIDYGVNCGYSIETNEIYQMYQHGTYQFKRNIYDLESGTYDVTFTCIDNTGKQDSETTTFIII
jgi:hypothetical protein